MQNKTREMHHEQKRHKTYFDIFFAFLIASGYDLTGAYAAKALDVTANAIDYSKPEHWLSLPSAV
ncbi:MAG TPA: hypothetical protein PKK26_11135, partial [Candidatus Wallbacteria bacterium]|nr:hypothetical protein [Candidatus Wallbacteria bacterium]